MNKVIAIALVLTTISVCHAQPSFSKYYYERKAVFDNTPDTKDEIIFLGNSITEGGKWEQHFPKKNVRNRGISGDVSDGILYRLPEITASFPKKVFIMIGTNDLAKGKSVSYIIERYEDIVKQIQNHSKETIIYIQSVLPVNPKVGNRFSGHKSKQEAILELNRKLQMLSKRFNLEYINLHKAFCNRSGALKPSFTHDGLHLTKKGYKKWRRHIKDLMN
ncbi:GDSL-type esterase/lipase family protein [Aestuariivivens insulae]|uniref:GDSL-type esterase/lipase family protein n=1 Tax=Aestuariivivens insulae TaxID=1621988 RepID=UPI001F595BB1|nr:GDSL-type esterase/lipase family protein [Aestuariivivens insulae]